MNINVPKNIKSPTVIIVGQQDDREKENVFVSKRMDLLERKIDQQYKSFIASDKSKDYIQTIEGLQKSFMSSIDKLLETNKNLSRDFNVQRINDLKKELNRKIDNLKTENNDEILKSFVSKLGSLESSIKNIKPRVRVVNNGNKLDTSFENLFKRLEEVIRASRPKMIPYVS